MCPTDDVDDTRIVCYVLTAVLADRLRLCSWVSWCPGHGVDGTQLGVGQDDSAGSDS